MPDRDGISEEVREIGKRLNAVFRDAAATYSVLVDDVINGRITDLQTIERIMDGLNDFADAPACGELFSRLHWHVYDTYPELLEGQSDFYRRIFADTDTADSG